MMVAKSFLYFFTHKGEEISCIKIEQALQSDEATYYIYCPECKARIELNKVKILVDKQQNDASNVNNH